MDLRITLTNNKMKYIEKANKSLDILLERTSG